MSSILLVCIAAGLFHSYVKYFYLLTRRFHSYVKYFVKRENAVISGVIERFPYIRYRAGGWDSSGITQVLRLTRKKAPGLSIFCKSGS